MSYDLMFQKAIELQNNGALNEAEDIYLKLLEAMPENSDVWNLLGLAAQSKGNAGRAADCFLAAIRYAPAPFAPHFFNLGLAYRMLGKKREALEALQRAADLQPDLKEAWNYLGLTQEETGDHQEAIKSFCRALDIDGAYNEARANLCFYTKDKETLTTGGRTGKRLSGQSAGGGKLRGTGRAGALSAAGNCGQSVPYRRAAGSGRYAADGRQ